MHDLSKPKKWYDKTWLVIILCITFLPVGLYALWKNSSIRIEWKLCVTCVIAFICISEISNQGRASSDGYSMSNSDNESSTPYSETNLSYNEDNNRKTDFNIGEEAKLDGLAISVLTIEETKPDENVFNGESNTNKFIGVKVRYRNISSSDVYSMNPLDWKFIDNTGVGIDHDWFAVKNPEISSRKVMPNEEVTGWMLFKIPRNNSFSKIQYSGGNIWSGIQAIEFK